MSKNISKVLREGFTTGSAVSAAEARVLAVLLGAPDPESLSIPLPPNRIGLSTDGRITIPLKFCRCLEENGNTLGYAGVIKDAGDDPDVTDGILMATSGK